MTGPCSVHCGRLKEVSTHRRLLAAVQVVRVAAQRAAAVQLDVEFVIVPPGAVDVDAERIVSETSRINDARKGAVEADSNLHVIVLAFRRHALHPRHVEPLVGRFFLLPPVGRLARPASGP